MVYSTPAHHHVNSVPGLCAGSSRRWLPWASSQPLLLLVSYSAQYRMVYGSKRVVSSAALEAAIRDVAALIFATLGIALALHGKRAIRMRFLNIAAVATSVAMNVLAPPLPLIPPSSRTLPSPG
jgi:hypothetical protein